MYLVTFNFNIFETLLYTDNVLFFSTNINLNKTKLYTIHVDILFYLTIYLYQNFVAIIGTVDLSDRCTNRNKQDKFDLINNS